MCIALKPVENFFTIIGIITLPALHQSSLHKISTICKFPWLESHKLIGLARMNSKEKVQRHIQKLHHKLQLSGLALVYKVGVSRMYTTAIESNCSNISIEDLRKGFTLPNVTI